MISNLHLRTRELLRFIQNARNQFESAKTSGKAGDFYTEVKPFADLVKQTSDEWADLAVEWLRQEQPTHITLQQVQQTCEHLEAVSIQSFYPTTSRKRFLSAVQSAQFVLESILNIGK